jgi:hypothetical protein
MSQSSPDDDRLGVTEARMRRALRLGDHRATHHHRPRQQAPIVRHVASSAMERFLSQSSIGIRTIARPSTSWKQHDRR